MTQTITIGGSFDLADGVAGLFSAAPLQPADTVDAARVRIVSTAVADPSGHTCTVEIYVNSAVPPDAAAARRGTLLFSATMQPIPALVTVGAGNSTAVGVVNENVPALYTADQRFRILSIIVTYSGAAAKGLVLYNVFRGTHE